MFNQNIRLYGKHATILKKYSNDKSSSEHVEFLVDNNDGDRVDIYLFDTLLSTYLVAGMIGIIENRKVLSESSNSSTYATIFLEKINKEKRLLERMYQHMILSEANEDEIDSYIKKAFTINKADEENEQRRLEDYVRGGLEIIDEIFSKCSTYEDVANALIDLKNRYYLG